MYESQPETNKSNRIISVFFTAPLFSLVYCLSLGINRIISVFFIAPLLLLVYCLSLGVSRIDKIIGHVFFLNILSINAETMKHTTPAKIALFDDVKPNPAANINMLPSNIRIIGIALIACSCISAISIQKNQVASRPDHAKSHR